MTTLFFILFCLAAVFAIVLLILYFKTSTALTEERRIANAAVTNARATVEEKTAELERERQRIQERFEGISRKAIENMRAKFDQQAQHVREHYETEARKAIGSLHAELSRVRTELEPLRALQSLHQSEEEVRATLKTALTEAEALRTEAQALMDQARQASAEERKQGQQRAKVIFDQAEALLAQATRDSGRIVAEAQVRAQKIGGDAYLALREKQMLEDAVKAVQNILDGYGDRYVIPTHSVLDDLAADFGHTAAGESLRAAREQTRRMVQEGQAAACDYVEANRRETAIRFVVDAFNGRVDAILSRAQRDNCGTLEQEIRDAYSLVNHNGEAFRNARVLETYRDARIAELRWAVVVQELRVREREEQRRIQEQIREEEKARREYERAMQEAMKEEETIRKAMEKAKADAAHANAQERLKYEAQLSELAQKLAEAEEKNQRAISMAQQTRSGHVYIISNIGSFGEDVLKIGMTRRLEPMDRVKELGDASVPFSFDVHAMVRSDDAPSLENKLHSRFDEARMNKVNYRKEFFRVSIRELRDFFSEEKIDATFTMAADAREYRESLALEKMTPEEREKYRLSEKEVGVNDD